jgi:hypothetical protein
VGVILYPEDGGSVLLRNVDAHLTAHCNQKTIPLICLAYFTATYQLHNLDIAEFEHDYKAGRKWS